MLFLNIFYLEKKKVKMKKKCGMFMLVLMKKILIIKFGAVIIDKLLLDVCW